MVMAGSGESGGGHKRNIKYLKMLVSLRGPDSSLYGAGLMKCARKEETALSLQAEMKRYELREKRKDMIFLKRNMHGNKKWNTN